MTKCPECGSTRIEQYMMPYGPMWCMDCGFRVEEKMDPSNPFINTDEDGTTAEPPGPPLAAGAALYELIQAKNGVRATEPPKAGQGDKRDPVQED